ncbi:hypothetical protein ACJRO7_033677 [Eucalyptus globulus]|uniref:Uncharacterized protein n=1 Tax=Eucalyptus globulus TaxID=34317 RepID=A0ABD3JS92_EUCGL
MEFEDVKSDLYALRKLYELLQRSADGPLRGDAIYLDKRAQMLFKDLLDYATERTFRTFRQIVSAQSNTRESSSSPQPLHLISTSESLVLPDQPRTSSGVIDILRDPILHDTPQKKGECLPAKRTPNKLAPESSKLSILSSNQGSQRKQCRVCHRNIMKQQTSSREPEVSANSIARTVDGQERIDFRGAEGKARRSFEDCRDGSFTSKQEPRSHNRVLDLEHQARIAASIPISTNSLAFEHRKTGGRYENKFACEIIGQSDGASDFTKDLTNTIKQIEARIYVLQLYSQNGELITKVVSQSGTGKAVSAIRPMTEPNEQKFTGRMLERSAYMTNALPLQERSQNAHSQENLSQACQLPSEKPKHGASNFTSHQTGVLPRDAGQNQSWNLTAESCKDLLSQTSLRNEFGGIKSGTYDNLKQKKTLIPPQNVKAMVEKLETMSQSLNRNTHAISVKDNMVQGLMVPPSFANVPKKPPLPVSQKQMARENSAAKFAKSRLHIPSKSSGSIASVSSSNKFRSKSRMPLHVTLKPTLMDQFSNKKEVRTRRQTQRMPKKSSLRTRNKMVSPLRGSDHFSSSSRSSYISRTSDETSTSSSDSEAYADTDFSTGSGRTSEELSSSSYSVPTHNGQADHSYTLDRNRGSISSHPTNREKGVGRLRRMKNKLGLIFHHHHHHHHHHHQGYSDDRDNKLQRRPTTSMWKQMRDMFHRRNERDVNKATKSGKHQAGPFHALTKGFLRHLQHTKNSKASTGNRIRVHKKKKSSWWPKLRHHGGMKLANRGRVKLKLPGKRPRMKALKMH